MSFKSTKNSFSVFFFFSVSKVCSKGIDNYTEDLFFSYVTITSPDYNVVLTAVYECARVTMWAQGEI